MKLEQNWFPATSVKLRAFVVASVPFGWPIGPYDSRAARVGPCARRLPLPAALGGFELWQLLGTAAAAPPPGAPTTRRLGGGERGRRPCGNACEGVRRCVWVRGPQLRTLRGNRGGDRNRKMYTEAAAKNLPKGAEVKCVGILGAPATVGPRFQSGESL